MRLQNVLLALGLSILSATSVFASSILPRVEGKDEVSVDCVRDSKWTPYPVGGGYVGVCGRFVYPSEFGVALSVEDFQPSLCNRIVSLTYGNRHAYSQILDVCTNCARGNLNLTEHLFKYFSSDVSTPVIGEWELANG